MTLGCSTTTADLLAEASRALSTAFRRQASRLGLTGAQARLVYHLARTPDLTQAALADVLGISPVSVSESLEKLCTAGLVERIPHATDRRAIRLRLTEKARVVVDGVQTAGGLIDETALHGLTRGQRENLRECLIRIRENLPARVGERPRPAETADDVMREEA